jgi:glycosyltransferase involved in cell wall biosynthesis
MNMLISGKIIFFHLIDDFSGSPKVLSQVIKSAQKNGLEVELFTGGNYEGFLTGSSGKHFRYFYRRFNNKFLTLLAFLLSQVHLFVKLLKYRDQDVQFYINTMLPFGAALAGKLLGKTVYYHIHETSIKPYILKYMLRFFVEKTSSKVLFVSRYLADAESFRGVSQSVIYNALPLMYSEISAQCSYQHKHDESFNVLMVCSLRAYKGVDEFIAICKSTQMTSGIHFTLVLNSYQSEIDLYFEGTSLPSNVSIFSKQENIIPFYKKSSLVLNLSRIDQWIETFGLTILEALSFGIPVIVPPVGGPSEIVSDGINGYLVSSYEVNKISEMIIGLSKNEKKCLALSNAARSRSEHFHEEVFEEKIITFLGN